MRIVWRNITLKSYVNSNIKVKGGEINYDVRVLDGKVGDRDALSPVGGWGEKTDDISEYTETLTAEKQLK